MSTEPMTSSQIIELLNRSSLDPDRELGYIVLQLCYQRNPVLRPIVQLVNESWFPALRAKPSIEAWSSTFVGKEMRKHQTGFVGTVLDFEVNARGTGTWFLVKSPDGEEQRIYRSYPHRCFAPRKKA